MDLVAGSTPDNIFKALEMVMQCPAVDSMMFLSMMPALRIRGFDLPTDETERAKYGDVLERAVAGAMDELNKLVDKYNKPLVVATEHIWATNKEEARIPYILGQQNAVCYHMPHEAADVLRALVSYSEYLKRARPIH